MTVRGCLSGNLPGLTFRFISPGVMAKRFTTLNANLNPNTNWGRLNGQALAGVSTDNGVLVQGTSDHEPSEATEPYAVGTVRVCIHGVRNAASVCNH